jgi:tetratricopeptide (TPR) repeat protein
VDQSLVEQFLRFTKQEDIFDSLLAEYDEEKEYTPERLSMFGFGFVQRFRLTGKQRDIEQAVQVLERTTRKLEPSSEQWQQNLNNLGTALMTCYVHLRKLEHLNRAIRLFGQLAEYRASDVDEQPDHLLNLCSCLMMRFQATKKIEDLDRMIRLGQEIIEHTTSKATHRQAHLENHASVLLLRFVLRGDLEDQRMALHTMVLLESELPENSPRRMHWIDQITREMSAYTAQAKNPLALTDMILLGERLIAGTPPEADYLPMLIGLNGGSYLARFSYTDKDEDMAQAIQHMERALVLNAPAVESKAGAFYQMQCYYNLGAAFKMRYSARRNLDDLQQAIEKMELAVAQLSPDFQLADVYHDALAGALELRFERTEDLADLERAKQLRAKL